MKKVKYSDITKLWNKFPILQAFLRKELIITKFTNALVNKCNRYSDPIKMLEWWKKDQEDCYKIMRSFSWRKTQEGMEFWRDYSEKYTRLYKV